MKSHARMLGYRHMARPKTTDLKRQQTEDEPIDDKPRSVYEIITRQMLDDVRQDIIEIKGRVNTVLWLMVGAILIELLVKLVK